MRITLTLEPDVARNLRRRVRASNLTLQQVVNRALRTGLSLNEQKTFRPFQLEPHSCGLRAGIDPDKLNQLADDLEMTVLAKKLDR